MKRHYWTSPIAIYLFLGGLGGGIMFLAWIMSAFVFAGQADVLGPALAGPMFIALLCLALGCFFLVFELGQPPVFWRVFTTATAIIKWGATMLSIAMFFNLFYVLAYVPWFPVFENFFMPFRAFNLGVAGIMGLGIMIYTGVMLSTLKAHSFWATPALPILFTTSATSTGCAAISLSLGVWPGSVHMTMASYLGAVAIHEVLHVVDIVLVFVEIGILLIMVLSFLGSGTRTAKRAAKRWVSGAYAGWFWIGMIGFGLVIPLCMYLSGVSAMSNGVAPVLVLCGGLLLRYLCVWTDDRQPLPGEERYYNKLPKSDAQFLHAWEDGDLY
jgi:polysulfide reductase chain C